jgi:Tfp pilus assembly protein PilN
MKRVHIDFAPPSLARTLYRTGPLAWVLAVVAVLLCVGAAATGWQIMTRQRLLDAQLALARTQVKVTAVSATAAEAAVAARPQIGAAQAQAVNAAVLQLNLPWRALQDAVEQATPKQVALIALEPDPRRRSMKITAEAKNSDDMIAYVERLKRQELFGTGDGAGAVTLLRHEINEVDPNRPIRFQLEAEWRAP